MKSFYSQVKRNICATLTSKFSALLIAAILILQAPASAQTTGLIFTNPTLYSGTDGANGAVYRFPDAAPGVDVLVEIISDFPVKLISFDVALINKKITITWSTSMEKDASHFVIERSTNGVDFTDAGIIFTEGNSETARSYSFKDPVSTSSNGILYYRLRIVDLDRQYKRSAIRIIKLGQSDGKLELQTFPNPVVNELRITIPESWQGKPVIYELYTQDGQLLKRFLNKSATQTEVINMQLYQPGTYIVKALNDTEIASQHIIKRH